MYSSDLSTTECGSDPVAIATLGTTQGDFTGSELVKFSAVGLGGIVGFGGMTGFESFVKLMSTKDEGDLTGELGSWSRFFELCFKKEGLGGNVGFG
jgi:hypothetical protein